MANKGQSDSSGLMVGPIKTPIRKENVRNDYDITKEIARYVNDKLLLKIHNLEKSEICQIHSFEAGTCCVIFSAHPSCGRSPQ